ncbi:helix-turn-helix domain-containing protein [Halocella sp. SP3-1]|uniref:helix-turn-helix domain-containing protein n=1 Tax=Halocella sp. SP3-1 TaxID=2382161 RepID=UPI000F75AACE|nr:helix-turn-helix domain-containing protein [Halocella sp. SP3-1]AZO96184.1 DNA-binding protein [Halocella sp. SP3-1]
MTPLEIAQKDSIKELLDKLPFVMPPKQARSIIDVGHNKIYEILNSGELPATKLHGKWLVNKYDLIEFILGGGMRENAS